MGPSSAGPRACWPWISSARHGESLADATFYSDSITDLPLLERVGVPRPVNADLRLTRVTERSGWPLLRFYRVIGPA
jgi:phosphoserine phosphatase